MPMFRSTGATPKLAAICGTAGVITVASRFSMKNVPAGEFDRQYSKHMNMDHSKALALFESASKSDDPQLAEFAQKTLPTLKEHKQMAEKLPANMKSKM